LRFKHNCSLLGQEGPEIINSVTGKDDQGVASRLSKQGLFRRFMNLVGRIGSITGLTFGSCPRQYSALKEAVQDYKVIHTGLFFFVSFVSVCFVSRMCGRVWRRCIHLKVDMNLGSCIKVTK
jgi:hypothetical protein